MSTNQTQGRQASPEEQEAQAKAVVGGLLLVATLKYLPVVAAGLIFGIIVNIGARGQVRVPRVRSLVLGLLFFAIPVFVLFGLPIPGETPRMFGGVILRSDTLQQLVGEAVRLWNSEFPRIAVIKAMRFDGKITFFDVSCYFGFSIAIAAAFVILCEAWRQFKPQDPTKRPEIGLAVTLCRIPEKATSVVIYGVLTRWIESGRATAWSMQSEGIKAFLRGVVQVLILGLSAGLTVAYGLPKLMPVATVDWLGYLAFGPALGVGLGFLLGAVDFVTNGRPLLGNILKPKTDEFFLGTDFQGHPYGLSNKNLSYHVEIIAPTGSGKTNLLKNLISDRIHRGHGLIFLDLKAEFQVVGWMMRAAAAAGRDKELRLVSLANRELSVPYNPIKLGAAPEIHSQLMNSMSWSEDYYRKISSIALMTLLRGLTEYRDRMGENFHLGHLFDLLNEPGLLRAFNEKLTRAGCPAAKDVAMLAEKLDRPAERDKLTGLVANLGLLIHSAAGPLISEDVSSGSFDFREAVDEGRITYVLMNSMKLRETASVFGKMILQDLMRLAGDRYSEMDGGKIHRPVTLIIDEFASFAIPEFIEFMDRARGAGIGIVFAHQSRADLRAVTPEFQDRIEANSNTVIVSGVKSSEDAEYFAGQLGTRTVKKETVQVEDGFLGTKKTGMKSIRETEEYVVHPNRLKDLQQGEVFTVSRTVDARWALVKVPQAAEFLNEQIPPAELVMRLEAIRKTYMTGSKERYLDLATATARGPGLAAVKSPKRGNSSLLDEELSAQASTESEGTELWS
ncbi:type IV secretory system conjugative DNA transfer family protein [Bdellovibrionota bacterium FG-1]